MRGEGVGGEVAAVMPRGWLGTGSRRLGPWLVAILVALARKYEPSAVLAAVNIGGLGAAWLVFLPWAAGEKILAFQLA